MYLLIRVINFVNGNTVVFPRWPLLPSNTQRFRMMGADLAFTKWEKGGNETRGEKRGSSITNTFLD